MSTVKKKSPRAPSFSLDDAIERTRKVYEKERLHAGPSDVIAQDMGYKNANSGAALAALASLRYYGLLNRPREGQLAVSKDFEHFLYAPDATLKQELLNKWIRSPAVFLEIIDKYGDSLPSDATLRFDLISQGFNPTAAEALIPIFKRSAELVGLYGDAKKARVSTAPDNPGDSETESGLSDVSADAALTLSSDRQDASHPQPPLTKQVFPGSEHHDHIPVRLSKGRRAVLVIPYPFYAEDKKRLIAQIDLLLTDEEQT
ncbi:hypothetical protein [Stenotrophomonas rhizophila]|uniref:hypothetical protein n=1 Tax=Stenotrophomonas rhizophila TaxID=216778 RepID=UPI00081C6E46|nr:hypothetical protein [Stenotrophomonas rhizophila]AOA71012.1 hypothetical protein BAY15_0578 [Stenotrophomonas rhizophila]